MDDVGYCATTLHMSSDASADPSDNDTATTHDDAISDLSGMKDRLRGVLTHYEGHHVLLVYYSTDHFQHDPGSIGVDFKDLHLFFNFNMLDATLVRCLIL
ncbi:hypothetical protein D1007_21444 [Hordeum vulgare]|nr:hypothetical protein D1007_21444 [Hordeum vulgare]